jgi:hypothetical protein
MKTTTDPHELLATVPYLIGYHPTNSIVFIAIRDNRAGVAMRMDYPAEENLEPISLLVDQLIKQEAGHVVIVFYLPDAGELNAEFVDATTELLESSNIKISEFIVVKKNRWRSLLCSDLECCTEKGRRLPQHPKGLILQMMNEIDPIDYSDENFRELQRAGALAVNDLVSEFKEHGVQSSLVMAAMVLVRLQDLQVRDYAIGVASDEMQGVMLPMWKWLASIAPKGFIAPALTLYAELAYEAGEPETALRAIERALEDDPSYQLAKLLRRTYAAGWPVESFHMMRSELHPRICASLFDPPSKE